MSFVARFGRSRLRQAVLLLALLSSAFTLSFAGTSEVLATQIAMPGSSYYTVQGHAARAHVQAVVSFEAYSSWMDVWENSGYVYVTNGTANCRRSRVFGDSWELLWNWGSSTAPYPITAPSGWQFDSIWFFTVTDGYPMRGYYQFTSNYDSSTGHCAYGGGVGWEKPGQVIAWNHWPTSIN